MKTYKKDQNLASGQVVDWVGWGLLYASNGYIRLLNEASEHFFLQGITLRVLSIYPIPE